MTEKQFRKALGGELRRIREARKLSRQQLENRTGVHRNSIVRYEAGADIPIMTFIRLCVGLDYRCVEVIDKAMGGGAKVLKFDPSGIMKIDGRSRPS